MVHPVQNDELLKPLQLCSVAAGIFAQVMFICDFRVSNIYLLSFRKNYILKNAKKQTNKKTLHKGKKLFKSIYIYF